MYDCGSSLYLQANEVIMRDMVENRQQRDLQIFSLPLSDTKIYN